MSKPVFDNQSDEELWLEVCKEEGIDPDTSEPLEEKEETEEPEQVEEPAEEQSKEEPEQVEEEKELPYYAKGKSIHDLIDMIENSKKKISSQNNKIYELSQAYEKMQGATTKAETKEAENELDKALQGYSKEDIKVIEMLTESLIEKRERQKLELTKKQKEENINSNESDFAFLQDLNESDKSVIDDFRGHLEKEYKSKGEENTLQKSGWVRAEYKKYFSSNNKSSVGIAKSDKTSKDDVIRRKKSAATANSSGMASTGLVAKWKGKPEPSNPDDYLDWYKANTGVEIPVQR